MPEQRKRYDAGIRNKGDDAHAAAATTHEGIRLENFLNQLGPRGAGFPRDIRIVPLGKVRCRQAGGFVIWNRHENPPAVGIGPVKLLDTRRRFMS